MQSWPTEIWENGNNPEKSNCSAEGGISFISEAKHPTVCKSEQPCEKEEESWELPPGLAERGCVVCIKHRSTVMKISCKIFQVVEWGSWCQISRGLVLAVAFRKLALVLLASSKAGLVFFQLPCVRFGWTCTGRWEIFSIIEIIEFLFKLNDIKATNQSIKFWHHAAMQVKENLIMS